MFVPDLSSRGRPGHSQHVSRKASSLLLGLAALLLCSCASSSDEGAYVGPGVNPWVAGGQTGALIPDCGLTPAAADGDSIPGGDSGIVLYTDKCVGFAAAELELHDQDGMMVAFDLEPLPGGAVLLRPKSPLPAGIYSVNVAGTKMEAMVAEEPAELPMRLGTLRAPPPQCGASAELELDPAVLEYLPQLKLSLSIDGEPETTWFDYGELMVQDGRASIGLESCGSVRCLPDGEHTLRVTGELAGELGTLAPVEVTVETRCLADSQSGGNDSGSGSDAAIGCGLSGAGRKPASGHGLLLSAMVAGVLALRRRARRSSA
jgi:hypothetical protein